MSNAIEYFVDEQGTNLNSFIMEKDDGTQENIKLYRNANISKNGTPLNAANLNVIVDSVNNIVNPDNATIIDFTSSEGLILITKNTLELKEGKTYVFSNYNDNIAHNINKILSRLTTIQYQHIYIGYNSTTYPIILGGNSIYFIPSYFTMQLKYHNPNEIYNKPYFELIGFEGYNYANENFKINYECSSNGILKIYAYNLTLVGTESQGIDIPLGLNNSNVILREILYANVSQHTNPSINAIVSGFDSNTYIRSVNIKWNGSSTSLKASLYIVGKIAII
jgi:hypothetical protein